MDFIVELKQFSIRVEKLKDKLQTEEATKTSLILPFFQLMGYDIFDPEEFMPEFTADVGIKKGEKVDYAIMQNHEPSIIIEAKQCTDMDLDKYTSQLFRYFGTTKAKFAILTNGIVYRFYTDLDEPNKMDIKPFLEFNVLEIKENTVEELKKFQKENFDIDTIMNIASELKYSTSIKQLLSKQFQDPTDSFINYILSEVYSGRKTQNIIDKFREVVRVSLHQYLNEQMNDKIKMAFEKDSKRELNETDKSIVQTEDIYIPKKEDILRQVDTTVEELEFFFSIKSMTRDVIEPCRINYKDTLSYFGVLYDNNVRKWICRLYVKDSKKFITLPDENKNEIRYDINSVEEIFNYKEQLLNIISRY